MSPALVFLLFFTTTSHQFVGAEEVQMEPITESFASTAGPFYDPRSEKLYFTDVVSGRIYRYDFFTQKVENISLPVAAIVIPRQYDINYLVVGAQRKVFGIRWNIGEENYDSMKELMDISGERDPYDNPGDSTFLQGRADVNGHLWFGTTMGYPADEKTPFSEDDAGLYELYANGSRILQARNDLTSGEEAWNFQNTLLYYVEPGGKYLITSRYNALEDSFEFQGTENFQNLSGYPVGLAVDTNGHVWISTCGEGYIYEFDPNKKIIVRFIKLPVKYITDITFGTRRYDTLYATTSRVGQFSDQPIDNHTAAGAVFAITKLGVKGFPLNYASYDFK